MLYVVLVSTINSSLGLEIFHYYCCPYINYINYLCPLPSPLPARPEQREADGGEMQILSSSHLTLSPSHLHLEHTSPASSSPSGQSATPSQTCNYLEEIGSSSHHELHLGLTLSLSYLCQKGRKVIFVRKVLNKHHINKPKNYDTTRLGGGLALPH